MKKIAIQYFKSPVGELIIGSYNNALCLCDWKYRKKRDEIDNRITKELMSNFVLERTMIINETISQLNEYFARERQKFDIPLLLIGTQFQKTIWNQLLKIPYAETISYAELAQNINKQEAIRAVAAANGANAISIIVPCHRVIAANGKLTGYAGGLRAKQKLIELEKNCSFPKQLTLF